MIVWVAETYTRDLGSGREGWVERWEELADPVDPVETQHHAGVLQAAVVAEECQDWARQGPWHCQWAKEA